MVLTAILREATALRDGSTLTLALAPVIQARLCWLLSCWWAFGGDAEAEADRRATGISYSLIVAMLSDGIDMAVRR